MPKIVQRFCNTCGQLMWHTKTIKGYDVETGNPDYEYVFKCRNWKWYTPGHSSLTLYVDYRFWKGDNQEED